MTSPQINQSLLIKEDVINVMFYVSLGVYFQGRTQPSIDLLKVKKDDWDTII